jgi:hypothetical protein
VPQKQAVRISFPTGGRVDRYAFADQPVKTTVSSLNVWPDAMGRERGGSRPGFTKTYLQDVGGSVLGLATLNFIPDSSSRIVSRLCIVEANGDLFTSDSMETGSVVQVTNTHLLGTGATTEILQMTERNQKLYIAGHSIVQATSESTWKLHVYDPVASTVVPVVATDGLIPRGANCICTWRDRIVLGGGTTDPYGVKMSRQGEPEDWDFSEEDAGAAVDLGLAHAGLVGQTVTSLTPHADNCLIIGCPSSLWMLQGDPTSGGQVANLSMAVGVIGPNAWCTTADGMFVFLSHDGLYGVPAGCSSSGTPTSISRERLPQELLNIDASSATGGKYVSMAYDTRWRGIFIFVSSRTSAVTDAGGTNWFFDWETKSFWPFQFQEARMDVVSCHARSNFSHSESVVVCGCRDGYLRSFVSTASKDDEDESTEKRIESHLVLGPFGDEPGMGHDVRVDELDVALGLESGSVTWALFRGDSAEQAKASMDDEQEATVGQLGPGRNPRFYPRVRGPSVFLKLSSRVAWALESVVVLLAKLGRTRP